MKSPASPPLLVPLSLLLSLIAAPTALAQGAGRPHGPPPAGMASGAAAPTVPAPADSPAAEPAVVEEELGTVRDKFVAYRLLVLEGGRFYPKENQALLTLHRQLYQRIASETLGERLEAEQAREFVTRLIAAGEATRQARGSATSLTDEQAATATAAIDAIAKDVDAALAAQVDPDLFTPELNRREWLMEELVRFSATTGTGGRTRLLSRLESLLSAEAREKGHSPLSDSARSKLMNRSVEVWKTYLREFRE